MNVIYLVGKFNTLTQELSDSLFEQDFNVQLCSEYVEFLRGMLDVEEPDLILISLVGMDESNAEIFSELKFGYPHIPVICVGTPSEQENFSRFIGNGQFQAVERPISGQELARVISDRLEKGDVNGHNRGTDSQNPALGQPEFNGGVFKAERKKNILLVDDNAIQLRSLKGSLQNIYDVSMAVSGAEAIVQIGKKKPDLIFLDYEMPVCDGKMTLEMIRSIEENRDIPVVFLTGVNDSEHIAAVLKLKPAGYLLKPASIDKILEIVHKLLDD